MGSSSLWAAVSAWLNPRLGAWVTACPRIFMSPRLYLVSSIHAGSRSWGFSALVLYRHGDHDDWVGGLGCPVVRDGRCSRGGRHPGPGQAAACPALAVFRSFSDLDGRRYLDASIWLDNIEPRDAGPLSNLCSTCTGTCPRSIQPPTENGSCQSMLSHLCWACQENQAKARGAIDFAGTVGSAIAASVYSVYLFDPKVRKPSVVSCCWPPLPLLHSMTRRTGEGFS